MSLILDFFKKNYDNVTLTGDFNLSSDDFFVETFRQACDLTSLIKEATDFQFTNSTFINLISTNQKNMQKFSNAFETGSSDHHKLISTVANSGSFKGRPPEKNFK